jgi:cytochrome P450
MDDGLPSGMALTALDPAFREDPYPILAEIRRQQPVRHDTELGFFLLTRYDDVSDTLRNPDYLTDPRNNVENGFDRRFLYTEGREVSMLLMDEPEHRRLRNLVRRPFTPRAIEEVRGRVREVARRIVGEIDGGDFDLTARVASPIPTIVIAELLGIDSEHHEQFKTWSDAMIKTAFSPVSVPADVAAAEEASAALQAFFFQEIERRQSHPGADLISSMVASDENDDRLSREEIAMQCNLLLVAGNSTTSDLIGNAVMALLRNPAELSKLRARPELMKNAVEEVLRYDSPVTNSGRIAHEDLEIRGVKIPRGEAIAVSLAAANRDPEAYPDPDRFDIERKDIQVQSFGGGRHFCLGAHLARLEAAETLAALLERFPRLEMGPDGYTYAANPSFRGLARFSVRGER